MGFLVSIVKGSRHFEADAPIGKRVEARSGNETFFLSEHLGVRALGAEFLALAGKMGAVGLRRRGVTR